MHERDQEELKEILEATRECPGLEELLARPYADARMEAHVDQCPHCEAELALFESFEQPVRPSEAAPVAWIAKRLEGINWVNASAEPRREPAAAWWRAWMRPRVLASASLAFAALLIVTTAVQLAHRPGPDLSISESGPVRSQSVEVLEPLGVLRQAPSLIRWQAVPGATAYRVRLMEVDHTELWSATVNGVSVTLPHLVQQKILPGKRLLFDVTAINSNGSGVSSSGMRDFTLYAMPSK